jgi:hypothetical protein
MPSRGGGRERGRYDDGGREQRSGEFFVELNRAMAGRYGVSTPRGRRLMLMMRVVEGLDRVGERPKRRSGEGEGYSWRFYGPWRSE